MRKSEQCYCGAVGFDGANAAPRFAAFGARHLTSCVCASKAVGAPGGVEHLTMVASWLMKVENDSIEPWVEPIREWPVARMELCPCEETSRRGNAKMLPEPDPLRGGCGSAEPNLNDSDDGPPLLMVPGLATPGGCFIRFTTPWISDEPAEEVHSIWGALRVKGSMRSRSVSSCERPGSRARFRLSASSCVWPSSHSCTMTSSHEARDT